MRLRSMSLVFCTTLGTALGIALGVGSGWAQIRPSKMPRVAQVDPRFQSYNIEMVEIIGGRFWKPYTSTPVKDMPVPTGAFGIDPALYQQRMPVDLRNPRLRTLAAALGPAYLRVSGSWANTTYFQDDDAAPSANIPTGFAGVLTRAEWKGVADFAAATDAKIVTSFSVSAGTRDANGLWTPAQAEAFLKYTNSIGAPIAAAEFFNEPTFASIANVPKGYDGAAYGRDFAIFKKVFRKDAPGALLLGPGSVGEGIPLAGGGMRLLPTEQLLNGTGAGGVDAFSYHVYPAVSERCAAHSPVKIGTTQEEALTDAFLTRTDTVESFYAGLRDRYAPGKPLWLTETGQTACGGDRWASTFLDSFRYLYQLGTLARRDVQVVMHNTLAASDYGLIDEKTLLPRPNYWAALLWHNLMGDVVLDPGPDAQPSVHVFAGCMKGPTWRSHAACAQSGSRRHAYAAGAARFYPVHDDDGQSAGRHGDAQWQGTGSRCKRRSAMDSGRGGQSGRRATCADQHHFPGDTFGQQSRLSMNLPKKTCPSASGELVNPSCIPVSKPGRFHERQEGRVSGRDRSE